MSNENKNKVLFGICNVHVAKITDTNGTLTYGTPFAVPGTVSFGTSPEGESTPFYADNMIYYRAVSNNGYTGDLVLAITPEQFFAEIFGQEKDTNGAMFETSDDKNARFALMFEAEGDVSKRRFIYYDCNATRPSRDNATTEGSITPGTETLPITMTPRASDRVIKAVIEPSEDNKAIYDTFFTKVYEKDATVSV